jgi:hypothetical protein
MDMKFVVEKHLTRITVSYTLRSSPALTKRQEEVQQDSQTKQSMVKMSSIYFGKYGYLQNNQDSLAIEYSTVDV